MLPIYPAAFLCLIIIANELYLTPTDESKLWKFLALETPPASGEMTTTSFNGNLVC
jgi:hypothetical protein